MENASLQLFTVSSLEKIFPDTEFVPSVVLTQDNVLRGERYSFQAAYCLQETNAIINARVNLSGSLADFVSLRKTGLVPSNLPNYPDCDDFVLRTTPGLYPDPLYEFDGQLKLIPRQWHSLWITLPADCPLPEGDYELTLTFTAAEQPDRILGSTTFTLHRLNAVLPPQKQFCTQWFHTDCIADWYRIPVFSDRYWKLVEEYMKCAVSYGINMILTPLFTPPLDTVPGGERTTVQLVDVYCCEEQYSFNFDKLERWVRLCDKCGITYLEFSHLFTQWGAKHAPKIMAYQGQPDSVGPDAAMTRIFGWETDSTGTEYWHFLDAFLPALMDFIHTHHLEERSYFHISDEPHKDHLPQYLHAREIVKKHIGSLPVMDALSDYDYYEQGVVDLPICCNNQLEPFLEHHVSQLWTYHCCSQYKEVANRFFCMPSVRSRILGVQMYYYHIQGFLQWGYNFWNSSLSLHPINPFCVTDAECSFPSGDAFLVYPGENGPIGSLRGEVFAEALQDVRLFQLLESLTSRENVCHLIEDMLTEPLTFKRYPHEDSWLLSLRHKCQKQIAALTKI